MKGSREGVEFQESMPLDEAEKFADKESEPRPILCVNCPELATESFADLEFCDKHYQEFLAETKIEELI